MTDLEKKIYNTYLRILRTSKDEPYRARKNFDDFEENKQYPNIKKIGNLFRSCPHVSMQDYFIAPYKVYEFDEGSIYTLDFYASRKALGCYKRYMAIKEMQSPDEDHQIDYIKQSLQFILKYCLDNDLTFDKYFRYKRGFTYEWMKHYAERKISLVCLFEFTDTIDMIMGIEEEHRVLLLGEDIEEKFYKLKDSYIRSVKARSIVKRGIIVLRKATKDDK